jgi:hypothetical protein
LKQAAKPIDNPRAAEGFRIVKYNGYPRAGFFEFTQNFKNFSRESARGPCKGSVLKQNPSAAPSFRLKAQRFE